MQVPTADAYDREETGHLDGPVSSGPRRSLPLLPAQRLMAAHVALVVVATVGYMTVPATRTPLWAVIGLAGAAALVTGMRLQRPAHRWPWWVPAAGHFPIDVLKIDKLAGVRRGVRAQDGVRRLSGGPRLGDPGAGRRGRFHAGRPDELDGMLASAPAGAPRLVCLDGVDSMTGNVADLPAPAAVCRAHGATLYVDDAHGFGVIGERGPGEPCRYGARGNGVVRYRGESYDDIVPVGGFSEAYSSLLAFVALPTPLKNRLKTTAGPYRYSGPSPTASPATALAGLDVNDRRGDALRADPYRGTERVLDHLDGLGADTLNRDRLPIVEVPLADPGDLEAVAAFLWREGICVTPAVYPLVPRDRVGFRIQITALNSDEDIDRLNAVLTRLAARFPLRSRSRSDQSVKR
jgi:hypothetical protein